MISQLYALLLGQSVFSFPQAEDAAPVPSVCGLMPLEVWENFDKIKAFCICIADNDYDACTAKADEAGRPDDIVACGVNRTQDYNWCEIMNPCAQTNPPGIQILDASTTTHRYPNLSAVSRELDRRGLPEDSVINCIADTKYPEAVKVYIDVVSGVLEGAVGQQA